MCLVKKCAFGNLAPTLINGKRNFLIYFCDSARLVDISISEGPEFWNLLSSSKENKEMNRDRMFVPVSISPYGFASLLGRFSFAAFAFVAAAVSACAQTDYAFKPINFPGATATFAYALNDSGEAVGFYTGGGCAQTSCAFTYSKGTYTSFECVLENATEAFDINNKGQIVGAYSYYGGVAGFVYEGNNSCSPLGDPSANSVTEAFGVNSKGEIVGFYIDFSGNFNGFLYYNGTYRTIDCPGEAETQAFGIGEDGVIVGAYANSTGGPWTGFSYKNGICSPISYPGAASTYAAGMTKSGEITGWYTDSSGVNNGFVLTGTTFTEVDAPNTSGTILFHPNDAGSIAGFDLNSTGNHGFIAVPK